LVAHELTVLLLALGIVMRGRKEPADGGIVRVGEQVGEVVVQGTEKNI
jgi:hypothetical protein